LNQKTEKEDAPNEPDPIFIPIWVDDKKRVWDSGGRVRVMPRGSVECDIRRRTIQTPGVGGRVESEVGGLARQRLEDSNLKMLG
jgi:hypothetical protein